MINNIQMCEFKEIDKNFNFEGLKDKSILITGEKILMLYIF